MKTKIENRISAAYGAEDFGRGKSPAAKARHRRAIKRAAKRKFVSILKGGDE
ncbi:MAG: hypothetical protein LBQ73_07555 [Tannerellaceae bacterium]|jgi:hypothetical protein|nr:hypothetical protein [Tannerellaceae bacterium]